jgi:Ser/Thr protein kinase RdoA (MazF antagonist)
MLNMRVATEHMRRRLNLVPLSAGRHWVVPRVLQTQDGRDCWRASDGSFWRAISFIEGSQSFGAVRDEDQAVEVGYALGVFHALLNDLPPSSLYDTLQGFHITPNYLRHYYEVLDKYAIPRSPEVSYCMRFVGERVDISYILENARQQGKLLHRPIHGDPKVDNILTDIATGKAVSIVDLDTIRAGLVHYDIGDCLRSCCNTQGEEVENWQSVRFETDLCRSVLRGYLSQAGQLLTPHDFAYLYDSIRLIAFELGLRFFTDFLEGNIYFRIKGPYHNLTRALVHFKLTQSIESQQATIQRIIRESREKAPFFA